MFTTVKRHRWLVSTLRFVPVIAIAAAAMIAMAPTEARAQAFNVNEFACASSGGAAVDIDITGLGHTDLCVVSTVSQDVDCACAGKGGNCTSDAKKQSTTQTSTTAQVAQSKNGAVRTTVSPTVPTPSCTGLDCPSGQTATLIQFSSLGDFRVCTVGPSGACSPTSCTAGGALATAPGCGPATTIVNPGKKDSCVDLF